MMNSRRNSTWIGLSAFLAVALAGSAVAQVTPDLCTTANTVTANVVAFNQPITMNRLGAAIPGGMMFALACDIVDSSSAKPCLTTKSCTAGNVTLRPDKRPRPMVLRVNEGQCLQIHFTNLLDTGGNTGNTVSTPNPTTTAAGVHVQGLSWAESSAADGSFVGNNASSLVYPLTGAFDGTPQATYKLYAEHEGPHMLYSTADDYTKVNPGDGGTLAVGLFGAVIVEPAGSEWYRSQVTHDVLQAAADAPFTSTEFPKITDYDKKLAILDSNNEIVHSDLTAIITGPGAGNFPDGGGDLGKVAPDFRPAYSYPDRLEPYREFTIIYQETFQVTQAFTYYYQGSGGGAAPGTTGLPTIGEVGDNFGINYAFNGLGSPILANRLGLGYMSQCTDCKYEEFFLSAWAAGDPAMIVDNPTDSCISPTTGQKQSCSPPTKVHYPDDPSNVYHSYMGDHLKFRILHAGPDLHHLHHQHAHQWLASPSSPRGDYLDSQSIGPGSGFTLEYVYNGSGNVNQTVGDSIFHCHFYPHFASGMWGLWRVHDVFEAGTELDSSGVPKAGARALPDGEIAAGSPIPALVPIPGLAMAPLPAAVSLTDHACTSTGARCIAGDASACGGQPSQCQASSEPGGQVMVQVNGDWVSPLQTGGTYNPNAPPGTPVNPGFPFMIPGIAGSRAPHPPLDFAYACADGTVAELIVDFQPTASCKRPDGSTCPCEPLNGGLDRHIMDRTVQDPSAPGASTQYLDPLAVTGGGTTATAIQPFAQVDYSKKIVKAGATPVDEKGTLVERVAMAAHAERNHATKKPDGSSGNFILNGLPPVPGAPYADPCINFSEQGGPAVDALSNTYLAADVQLDAVFNKAGWHFPQQRILSLWGDVEATLDGTRAPEPMFLRVNSYDCMDYVYANLVPNVYELDDFQVRTPTDIIGQHIHLVKFDVTSSDGAANGWNYEDGTFGPNEVTERIDAIRAANNCSGYPGTFHCPQAKAIQFFGDGPGGSWLGAQATVQRWFDDPLLDNFGICSTDPTKTCRTSEPGSCPPGQYGKKGECWTSGGYCSNDKNTVCNVGGGHCGSKGICIPAYDRTIRTVFTHDHFSPSTHQQTGLYAGVVVEPKGSQWYDNADGTTLMGGFDPATGQNFQGTRQATYNSTGVTVQDGGPTSWQAVITTPSTDSPGADQLSYREFLLEFQDSAIFYQPFTVPEGIGRCSKDSTTTCNSNQDCKGKGTCFEKSIGTCSNSSTQACLADSDCGSGTCQPSSSPTGFCSYTGVCVDKTSGVASSTACLVNPQSGLAPTTGDPCTSSQICMLDSAHLVACTPDDDLATVCGTGLQQQCGTAAKPEACPQSCNFVTGVPSTSWTLTSATQNAAGNLAGVAGTNPGEFIDFNYKGVETITFQNSTYNFSVNYRTEPFYPRMTTSGALQSGAYGDLGFVYSSQKFCSGTYTPCGAGLPACTGGATCDPRQPDNSPYTAQEGAVDNDPFTPLLRAYAGDDVQIRTLVGAHINPHNFTLHDMNFTMEPSFVDSGWRNSQVMGISEHFELLLKVPPAFDGNGAESQDYLYKIGASDLEQAGGNWGLLRAYDQTQPGLKRLNQNQNGQKISNFCSGKTKVSFTVVALPGTVTYNQAQSFTDTNAVVFVNANDSNYCTTPGDPTTCSVGTNNPEPLVLRAAADDCIEVTLYNNLSAGTPTSGVNFTPVPSLNSTPLATNVSQYLGLRAQLVSYDPTTSDGTNAGLNPVQTVGPGNNNAGNPYLWYAGNIDPKAADPYIPIEFGTANLIPTDPLNHPIHETFAGLVVEPKGSKPASGAWTDAANTGPVTVIENADGSQFRDFAIFIQDSTNLPKSPQGTGTSGKNPTNLVNFRTESLNTKAAAGNPAKIQQPSRLCSSCDPKDWSCVLTSDPFTGTPGSCTQSSFTPETPIFQACAGEQVRFRVFHAGGTNTNQVFELYGHSFSEAPYMTAAEYCQGPNPATKANLVATNLYEGLQQANLHASSTIGVESLCGSTEWLTQFPPKTDHLWSQSLNEWKGSRMGIGPSNHFDAFVASAGGFNEVPGDYLYRSYPADHFNQGVWGLFRVCSDTGDCSQNGHTEPSLTCLP